jgi:hypothetical protein
MPDNSVQSRKRERRPVTDSPWFWLVLFIVAALGAIVVVSPKYAHRQARLERMNETRDQIARQAAGIPPASQETDEIMDFAREPSRSFTLGPLAFALSILLALSAVIAGVVSYLRSADRQEHAARRRKTT